MDRIFARKCTSFAILRGDIAQTLRAGYEGSERSFGDVVPKLESLSARRGRVVSTDVAPTGTRPELVGSLSFYIFPQRQKAPARVPVPRVAQPLLAVHLDANGLCTAEI